MAINIVGDRRLNLRPENLEINLIIKKNSINCEIHQLKSPPGGFLAPNNLNKDYTDGDESMVMESDKDAVRFIDESDDKDIAQVSMRLFA